MAIKGFDFEINGVKYNAAEDAEGDHYTLVGEPLRPPNAVTVQGENSPVVSCASSRYGPGRSVE